MPVIACSINGCEYATPDVDVTPQQATPKQKAPKIQHPIIIKGSAEKDWNSFTARWGIFKQGTVLAATEICQQLFSCCDDELGTQQTQDIF